MPPLSPLTHEVRGAPNRKNKCSSAIVKRTEHTQIKRHERFGAEKRENNNNSTK